MSEIESLNAGRLPRALTLLVVWIKTKQPSRFRSTSRAGLLSMFGFCIKVKPYADLAEAHAMQLVAQHTSVPVPKVYCAFVHRGATYIVMGRIRGQMAWLRWKERSEASRRQILDQLRAMVSQLRSIPRPEDIGVANVNGGPIYDCRLPTESFLGPFTTVQDFHKKLINCATLETQFGSPYEDLDELLGFYRNVDEKSIFTHGDLSSLNILVRGDDVVGIVDWETAGWLPSYWEYTSAWFVNPQNPFWQQEVDNFLTPMPNELKMETIRRKYFGYMS